MQNGNDIITQSIGLIVYENGNGTLNDSAGQKNKGGITRVPRLTVFLHIKDGFKKRGVRISVMRDCNINRVNRVMNATCFGQFE